MNSKAIRKQLLAAVAMVLVAAVALGSSTYAWFVSNNAVTATTSQINAKSNSAYLVIDLTNASTTSASAVSATDELVSLYPSQWTNHYDAAGKKSGDEGFTTGIYQFESAYAAAASSAAERAGTRYLVGAPETAVTKEYAKKNTFYVGTGSYDGEFTNLKVSGCSVAASGSTSQLSAAMRVLVQAVDADDKVVGWVVIKSGDSIVAQSGSNGVIYAEQFGKSEGDVKVNVYLFYDGEESTVFSNNIPNLTACKATVTFDATPQEFK